jgi:hypothetical protein
MFHPPSPEQARSTQSAEMAGDVFVTLEFTKHSRTALDGSEADGMGLHAHSRSPDKE